MLYLGVDLGGTNIKAGLVTDDGTLLAESTRPTALPRSAQAVCDDIAAVLDEVVERAGVPRDQIVGVGIGCPGTVDDETGVVHYSNNLNWHDFALRDYMAKQTGWRVRLVNDANAAALGEAVAGCAKGAHSAVVLTLGTGVGCGVVLEGKLLTGYTGAASELGHMVIVQDGAQCTCGRAGCLEAYASATALVRMTAQAMDQHPESAMHALVAQTGKINGRTAFAAKEHGDAVGTAVTQQYIGYLAQGVTNVINIFFPEVVAFSGGVANEGEHLLTPLREAVYPNVFGGMQQTQKHTRLACCTLGYRAGIIGAAMLWKQAESAL